MVELKPDMDKYELEEYIHELLLELVPFTDEMIEIREMYGKDLTEDAISYIKDKMRCDK